VVHNNLKAKKNQKIGIFFMSGSRIHKPHDKLFKLALKEIAVAKEFFNAHLPKRILEKIDLTTLKLESETFIDPAFSDTEAT
jgi:hypothetical protein